MPGGLWVADIPPLRARGMDEMTAKRGLLLIISCGLFSVAAMAADAGRDETRGQLEKLKTEIGKLQETLQQFKDERSKLQSDLRRSEVDIGDSQRKILQIQQQLEQQQQELQKLQERRKQLQQAKSEQQERIARQVRAAYQLGGQNKLKALLNQEEPDKVSRALVYYDYFNRARTDQIEAYIDVISQLDTMQPQIEEKAGSLRAAKADLDQQHKQLLGARQERERTFAKLNATIQSKDEQLKQMARDRSALEQVLKKIEREALARARSNSGGKSGTALPEGGFIASGQPFRSLRGQLPWPVAGKADNRFGSQRGGPEMRWQGINISAREGETVRAIHNGRVVFADWLRGSGLLIIIDHGDGYLSLYAHNQTLLRSTGDAVKGGDPIATVGNSGGQEQAGLYFEIRHKGVPTDPAEWCRRA